MKSATADNLRGLAHDAKQCSLTQRLQTQRLLTQRLLTQRLLTQRLLTQRLLTQRLLTQRLLTRRLLIYVHDLVCGLNWVSYRPGQTEQNPQQEPA
jgi:hypothetical protein